MNATGCTPASTETVDSGLRAIDQSCRAPLMILYSGAAVWLVLASVFGMLASLRFHSPAMLADCALLTYGRVYAASTNALLYGFAIPAGLGTGLWILARLGRTRVVQPWLIAFGGMVWNLGVLVGIAAILNGDSTGFENLEMPKAAAALLFIAYSLIGIWSLLTVHARQETRLEGPQWFILAALFWFPWIFSTAHLLLTMFPVRGVTQSVINWWFSANLKMVWLALMGLAAAFYLLTQLMNRALFSQYLALFTFWTILLFASWTGIPPNAPVPAWMPALSTVATVLTLVTILSVAVNVYRTVGVGYSGQGNPPPGKFVAFGFIAFVLSWGLNLVAAVPEIHPYLQFTWFTAAQNYLNVFGFFSMVMIGAIHYVAPRAFGVELCRNRMKASYWLLAAGVVLYVGPLLVGGVMQGIRLNNPEVAFTAVSKASLMPLRVSSLGELLILTGNVLLLWNLSGAALRVVCAQLKGAELSAPVAAEVKS